MSLTREIQDAISPISCNVIERQRSAKFQARSLDAPLEDFMLSKGARIEELQERAAQAVLDGEDVDLELAAAFHTFGIYAIIDYWVPLKRIQAAMDACAGQLIGLQYSVPRMAGGTRYSQDIFTLGVLESAALRYHGQPEIRQEEAEEERFSWRSYAPAEELAVLEAVELVPRIDCFAFDITLSDELPVLKGEKPEMSHNWEHYQVRFNHKPQWSVPLSALRRAEVCYFDESDDPDPKDILTWPAEEVAFRMHIGNRVVSAKYGYREPSDLGRMCIGKPVREVTETLEKHGQLRG